MKMRSTLLGTLLERSACEVWATQFEDFFGDLTKLRQVGTMRSTENWRLHEWASGKYSHTGTSITTQLTSAVGLARLFEAQQNAQKGAMFPKFKKTSMPPNQPPLPLNLF